MRTSIGVLPRPAIIAEAAGEECALITIGLGGRGDEALVVVLESRRCPVRSDFPPLPLTERKEVVGSAGFSARTNAGFLPPAKGLALNNRSSDSPVDIAVASLNPLQPVGDLVGVKRVNTSGESVLRGVLQRYCLSKRACRHDAKNGAKVLGLVESASRPHMVANAW